jgi:hypothetical protein
VLEPKAVPRHGPFHGATIRGQPDQATAGRELIDSIRYVGSGQRDNDVGGAGLDQIAAATGAQRAPKGGACTDDQDGLADPDPGERDDNRCHQRCGLLHTRQGVMWMVRGCCRSRVVPSRA